MLNEIMVFIAVGFAAQMVDGAIGMAYGLVSTSILTSMGIPPTTASASVHAAEVFTTGASGASHWRLGNVDRDLVWRLAVPGCVGGALGAYVLTSVPASSIRPFVSAYLLVMGALILAKALRAPQLEQKPPKQLGALGLTGGFLDAVGGGGWGALVTTTLIGGSVNPRLAIGSANAAEFFVTVVITATFIATVGVSLWPIITGLVIGGALAAPIAAYATKNIPPRPIMIIVSVVVMALSLRTLVLALR
jgi:uncharacterized protein